MPRYNNRELAHQWAAQYESEGQGSNFFFEGPTIYSYGYHFPIATFVNSGLVLFTTKGYSQTTSIHISHTRNAIPSYVREIHVDNIFPKSLKDHRENLKGLINNYTFYVGKQLKARTSDYTGEIFGLKHTIQEYCELFKVKLLAKHQAILDAPLEEVSDKVKKNQENAKKAKAAKKTRERRRAEADLQHWLRNEPTMTSQSRLHSLFGDYIRISKTGNLVQTLGGASVRVEDAKAAYVLFAKVMEEYNSRLLNHAMTTPTNYEMIAERTRELNSILGKMTDYGIGHYTVRCINMTTQVLQIGCHNIPFEEIYRVAKEQNWSENKTSLEGDNTRSIKERLKDWS